MHRKRHYHRDPVLIISTVAAAFGALEIVLPKLQTVLPEYTYVAIAVGVPVVTAVLRVLAMARSADRPYDTKPYIGEK